jgi:hypothetical protein
VKIAVIGGGIFGCTTAAVLSKDHEVHLFEKSDGLLNAASWANQLRLHRGYHYPRSIETALECQSGVRSFMEMYGPTIISGGKQYYAIADYGSKTSTGDFKAFCKAAALKLKPSTTKRVRNAHPFLVTEGRIAPAKLRNLVRRKLSNVRIHFNTPATWHLRVDFDRIVVAAYAATNQVALDLDTATEPFRYEVVEKPVLQMPARWKNTGVVVMDGPFCSLDPYGDTPYHVMGHVEHAIHTVSEGLEPLVPKPLKGFIHEGVLDAGTLSKANEMIEAGSYFLPDLKRAQHIGSMFVIRTVLPDRDDTDERPTMVDQLDDQVIRILSGKIPCAVDAARSVATIIERGSIVRAA